MKSRSREISIFSMSALDLFASALGAFILIAVALFPYFPNTGDSSDRVAEVKERLEAVIKEIEKKLEAAERETEKKEAELKEAEDELKETEEDLKRAKDELKRVKFPHLDLVVALDITGSMKNEIEGLKNEVDHLAGILLKLAPSLGMGVIAFGDRDYDTPTTEFDIRVMRTAADMRGLRNFTSTLAPEIGKGSGDNNDAPEAINLAMHDALAMSWRSDSQKKIVVIVTDNPVYPEEEAATLAQARGFAARGANHVVSTVHVNRGGGAGHTRSFLEALADAGGGQYVEGGGSMTANILRGLL